MDDLKDQSAVSTTATNGVVESEEEALLGDTDPSLTSADDVAKALNVDPSHGLSEEEAKRRLAKFGPNELASAPPVPKWKKFLAQFQDPLVYLLIAATIISVIAWFIEKANAQPGAEGGEVLPFDAIVIILILIVNAVLGYMQEAKAEAAVEALAQMTAPQTSVLRDDKVMRINTADVVPGDIIVLAEGDSVSADGRLVNAASLRIAEASLTGESGWQEAGHTHRSQGAGRPRQHDLQRHFRDARHRPRNRDRHRYEYAGRQDRRHALRHRR